MYQLFDITIKTLALTAQEVDTLLNLILKFVDASNYEKLSEDEKLVITKIAKFEH